MKRARQFLERLAWAIPTGIVVAFVLWALKHYTPAPNDL